MRWIKFVLCVTGAGEPQGSSRVVRFISWSPLQPVLFRTSAPWPSPC